MAEQSGDLLAPNKPRKGIGSRDPTVNRGFSVFIDLCEVGEYFLHVRLAPALHTGVGVNTGARVFAYGGYRNYRLR